MGGKSSRPGKANIRFANGVLSLPQLLPLVIPDFIGHQDFFPTLQGSSENSRTKYGLIADFLLEKAVFVVVECYCWFRVGEVIS